MSIFDLLVTYRQGIFGGFAVTVRLCAVIWTVGLVGGTALGVAAHRWPRAFGWPSRALAFVLAGIPVLVFLYWLHYPAQSLIGIRVDGFVTAAIALGTVNVFAVADTVRAALDDFPARMLDAARVSGLRPNEIVRQIQLPLIVRRVSPPLLMQQVAMLQATLFASLISVDELFRVAQRINAEVYRPVEVYSLLAVVFLSICLPLNGIALWLQRRFRRRISGA